MERSEKNVLYYVSFAKGLSIDSEEKLKPSSCAYKDNVYVDNVSGAGLGLFASRSFQVGELVLAEEPFLVLPCKAVTAAEAQSAVAAAVRKLSPALQNIFYSFSDKNTFGHAAQPKTIQGIVDTNGLPMGDQIGGNIPSSAGMYALMCRYALSFSVSSGIFIFRLNSDICYYRLNHSCRPNVHHQWNSRLKKQTIHCIRPISPGEELVTAYFNCSGLERSERQKLQKSKWNFNCSCERCLLSEEALVASDTRAREISRLDDGIEMMAGLNPRLGLQYVQQRIDLMKEEDAFDLTELVRTEFDAFQIW